VLGFKQGGPSPDNEDPLGLHRSRHQSGFLEINEYVSCTGAQKFEWKWCPTHRETKWEPGTHSLFSTGVIVAGNSLGLTRRVIFLLGRSRDLELPKPPFIGSVLCQSRRIVIRPFSRVVALACLGTIVDSLLRVGK